MRRVHFKGHTKTKRTGQPSETVSLESVCRLTIHCCCRCNLFSNGFWACYLQLHVIVFLGNWKEPPTHTHTRSKKRDGERESAFSLLHYTYRWRWRWRWHRLTRYNTIIEMLLQTNALCHTFQFQKRLFRWLSSDPINNRAHLKSHRTIETLDFSFNF